MQKRPSVEEGGCSEHSRVNWVQTKLTGMYEVNHIQMQPQRVAVKQHDGMSASGRGFKAFHGNTAATKVALGAGHGGHARPDTCS